MIDIAHIDHASAARVHTFAEATIDITPYQSPFAEAPIDIAHINHTSAERVHTFAEATIDITHINRTFAETTIDVAPYQSHARRTCSHGRRGHD